MDAPKGFRLRWIVSGRLVSIERCVSSLGLAAIQI